jgi:hypothetical protein
MKRPLETERTTQDRLGFKTLRSSPATVTVNRCGFLTVPNHAVKSRYRANVIWLDRPGPTPDGTGMSVPE